MMLSSSAAVMLQVSIYLPVQDTLNASVPDVSCSATSKDEPASTLDLIPLRSLQVLQSRPTRTEQL